MFTLELFPVIVTTLLVTLPLTLTQSPTNVRPRECELSDYELPNIRNMRVTRPIQMTIDELVKVQCHLFCYSYTPSLSNCHIEDDWLLLLTYINGSSESIKISTVSEIKRNRTGLDISFEPNFPSDPCANQAQNFSFFINLLMNHFIPELKEIFVICGLRKPNPTVNRHDPLNIVRIQTRDESINLYSTDIDKNPHKETFEGGNVSFTCTRPSGSPITPLWQLTSSNPFLSNIIINESISIQLNNDSELQVIFEDGEPYYNDTNLQQVQNFTITLVKLPIHLRRLTMWCGVETEDGQQHFYNRTVTVTVKEQQVIFSNDSDRIRFLRLLGTSEGKITCTKRNGYLSDVRVRLLSTEGTISNETELKYSTHKKLLNELGVKIKSGTSSKSDDLWQDFDILLKDIISNMTVECGARDPNELNSEFYNSVAVIATPQPDDETGNVCELTNPRVVSSISTLGVLLVIALVSETVIMLVALKLYCIHRVRRSTNQLGNHIEGEAMHINHSAIFNIEENRVVQQFGESTIGRNEALLAHCQVDEHNVQQAPIIDGQTVSVVLVDEQNVPQATIDGQTVSLADCQVGEQNVPSAPVYGQTIPLSQVIRVLPAEDRGQSAHPD